MTEKLIKCFKREEDGSKYLNTKTQNYVHCFSLGINVLSM